ncbi:hypothetical protein DFJ74DRAFT_286916 [Hyaloraphidium curvatum]|nr:hypothetical protein DFJ74DRAFT_286916 [Hyaloraphidium curvatum]
MPLPRSLTILSVTVVIAALLMGEDFVIVLNRDHRANLPKAARPAVDYGGFLSPRQEGQQDSYEGFKKYEQRAPLDNGCLGETCLFLTYGCDHNQTQNSYFGCACSASYLNSYRLCSSNCSHIPPFSLYRDFCISNGWFNSVSTNSTQSVNNGTGSTNATKPASSWGYPTRGCMTSACRKCIAACDPGSMTYDEVTACTCTPTFLGLLQDCYSSCPETAESPAARGAWCKKLADDAAALANATKPIPTTTTTKTAADSGASYPLGGRLLLLLQVLVAIGAALALGL